MVQSFIFDNRSQQSTMDRDSDLDEDLESNIRNFTHSLPALQGEELAPASEQEINTTIKSLKPGKAPGYDNISNVALKKLPDKVVSELTRVINATLRLGYFPLVWKHSIVISIPKPGKYHLFPCNYRPISLISCLGKIAEAIILSRLKEELFVINLIQVEQFGFRKGLSTDFQLFRLTEAIKNAIERRETVGAVFLDIEKAFDTV